MDRQQLAEIADSAERQAAYGVERLVQFAQACGLIGELDAYAARNALLDLLRIEEPYAGEVDEPAAGNPADVLEPLLDYAAATGVIEADTTTLRDLLDARMMGLLTPRPSEVADRFWTKKGIAGVKEATDAFYRMSIDSNYIRMDRIRRNLYWLAATAYGDLEITVNLSKPEKDPKEIAMLQTVKSSAYPKCLLCIENIGYAGRLNHPARQNLRVLPLTLGGERWYFQYSPYVYYNEHSIIFDAQHRPMRTSGQTLERLLEFVEQFPHYFIGANADLPIVGGSILDHDHYQGGRHTFPMERAAVETSFSHPAFEGIRVGVVHWPMSVIRLSGDRREPLLRLAVNLLEAWKTYSDPALDIEAFSGEGEQRVPHNTVTPIARRNASGAYEIDLVLRNNRTSVEHPEGIFHPHRDLHHIKKENIGLIEVMGLAVLPGRLHVELEAAAALLAGEGGTPEAVAADPGHALYKHASWLAELIAQHGARMTPEAARQLLREETGRKFARVLDDAGVFKRDDAGREGFARFLRNAGFDA